MSTEVKIKSDLEIEYNITPNEAREILWRSAILEFKLDVNQLEMVKSFENSESKTVVWNCSRRLGKSYTLCVLAIQKCLSQKNAIVKLLSPTQKAMRSILRPLMRELVADAPEDIKPVEKVADGIWYFPSTGSQIQMAGCDGGRAESVRGTNADLCIIDEAGFVSKDLEYIVNSILLPLTTTTRGKIILASTPPKSATHDFVMFMNQAKHNNSFTQKTIFDNPRLTKQDIDILANAAGGYDSVNFRREYLAQVITDSEYAIVPEFDEELKKKIVMEWKRPPFYDTYTAMDVGMKDLTVVLFAYFDFKANKLIIEDEYVANGQKFTTQTLAAGIREKEAANFQDPFTKELIEPLKRVSDNNLILINDLYQLHGLHFRPTRKDDADAALNNMRMLIKDGNIIINPKCKTLIRHLEAGIWNKAKTSFTRSGDNGHFDAIDTLKYLVRNVEFTRNPYPANYGLGYGPNVIHRNGSPKSAQSDLWKRIINMKK